SSIVYQVYFILLVFLFFSIDGHLLTGSVLYQSFIYWPIGSGLPFLTVAGFIYAIAWVFSAALLVTLSLVICLMLVQFSFGLLNRVSPAMNLFSQGFPLTILMGLLCIYLTLPNLAEAYLPQTRTLLDYIGPMLQEAHRV